MVKRIAALAIGILISLSLGLLIQSLTAQTPPYNFFPPPGYNCTAGPPAQIPYAQANNTLKCSSTSPAWNTSTNVLSATGGFNFTDAAGGSMFFNPATGSFQYQGVAGQATTSGFNVTNVGQFNFVAMSTGTSPGTGDFFVKTGTDSVGTGAPVTFIAAPGSGNGSGGTISATAGDGSGTGTAGIIQLAAGAGGANAAGGSNQFTAGAGGGTNGNNGGSNFFTAGSITAATGTGGNNAFAVGFGTTDGRNIFQDSSGNSVFFTDDHSNSVATTQSTAINRTNSFLYAPKTVGIPSGVPSKLTGDYANAVPCTIDTTDNRLYCYNSGWQNIGNISTPVTVPNGGTGLTTLTAHGIVLGEGASNLGAVAAMAADTLVQGQGTSADPAAVSVPDCGDSTHALAYSRTSHNFACQNVTGSVANQFSIAAKPGDTGRSSTTSPTDDPDLQFTSQAAGTYSVEWLMAVTGPTSTANLKSGINCTGTVTTAFWSALNRDQTGVITGNAAQNDCNTSTAVQTVTLSTASGNYEVVQGYGFVVTSTTGTISIQWSQGTTNVSPVTVKRGSWMRISKIL